MAPTPYAPNGQLDIHLIVGGLPHVVQLPVQFAVVGSTYELLSDIPTDPNAAPADVAQEWWDEVKSFYPASVAAPTWVLQERIVNIFVPVDAGSCANAGTNGGAYAPGMVYTLTFRDREQHLARVQLPEIADPGQLRQQYAALNADVKALVDEYLDAASPGSFHHFIRTRAGLPYDRFLFLTNTSNRKIRRSRGLA
jgi:hypothetical protein